MKDDKAKKRYSLLARLLIVFIIFLIILEFISLISISDNVDLLQAKSTFVTVIIIILISTVFFLVFGSKVDKWEKLINNSGSGRNMKWTQLLNLWPELSIDKKGVDKNYKKGLKYSRAIWWILALLPLAIAIYWSIKIGI
ncbi:MAG: hypothetical protein WC523_03165 [Patescibacteria group bacterium]|jgi:hypothetical protein